MTKAGTHTHLKRQPSAQCGPTVAELNTLLCLRLVAAHYQQQKGQCCPARPQVGVSIAKPEPLYGSRFWNDDKCGSRSEEKRRRPREKETGGE